MSADQWKLDMIRMELAEAAPFPIKAWRILHKLRNEIHSPLAAWAEEYYGRRYHIFKEGQYCWVVRTK